MLDSPLGARNFLRQGKQLVYPCPIQPSSIRRVRNAPPIFMLDIQALTYSSSIVQLDEQLQRLIAKTSANPVLRRRQRRDENSTRSAL